MEMDLSQGSHMPQSEFEHIEPGSRGSSRDLPFISAPADWNTNGVPYGAWCRCSACGLVGRSTLAFDFYAKSAGVALKCENCKRG